jgi:hypothetical protein
MPRGINVDWLAFALSAPFLSSVGVTSVINEELQKRFDNMRQPVVLF